MWLFLENLNSQICQRELIMKEEVLWEQWNIIFAWVLSILSCHCVRIRVLQRENWIDNKILKLLREKRRESKHKGIQFHTEMAIYKVQSFGRVFLRHKELMRMEIICASFFVLISVRMLVLFISLIKNIELIDSFKTLSKKIS